MYIKGEWFWSLGEAEREEAYILTDTCCLLCGESLEGESFVQWYFHGPQLDLAGMHLRCAHTMCVGMVKDLASGGALQADELRRVLDMYETPHWPAQATTADAIEE